MKKIIILLIAFCYLLAAMGATVNFHYCGGHLKKISLFNTCDEKACCGNKMKSKNCCKNKSTFVKLKDKYKSTEGLQLPIIHFKITASFLIPNPLHLQPALSFRLITPDYHAPPYSIHTPIYLRHRILLI